MRRGFESHSPHVPYKNLPAHHAFQREWQNSRYSERRAYAIEVLGGKCRECGSTERLTVHTSTEVGSSTIMRYGDKRFLETLKIAYLICFKCLNKLKVPRYTEHGVGRGIHNCKCEPCIKAYKEHHAARMKDYRKRKKEEQAK